jgi:N-acetylmuramoyl-L-alanine amidase
MTGSSGAKLTKFSVLTVKRILLFFGMCILLTGTPGTASADRQGFVNTVVIDAGHGGRDPGAVGKNSREKDITLAIALKLGKYINESMPDVKVIYTREKDEFVELFRRAQIANENHADFFISIHCNSAKSTAAYGTETFVMGLHRSDANLEVARKENASILFEEGYMETYEGYDPHSPVASIIFSLYQDAYLKQSLTMASHVQDQFRERAQRVDRGVKQAGFLVLYHVTMPGILVEAGFLSNPREEQYLLSESGQVHIASALFRAFRDYKTQQDALVASRKANPGQADNDTAKPDTEVVSQQVPEQPQFNSTTQQSAQKPVEKAEAGLNLIPDEENSIIFKVQFAVSSKQKPLNAPEFSAIEKADFYFHDGLYKYTSGNYKTFEEAAKQQAKLRNSGFSDAFVVAFRNMERIATVEAVRLVNQSGTIP